MEGKHRSQWLSSQESPRQGGTPGGPEPEWVETKELLAIPSGVPELGKTPGHPGRSQAWWVGTTLLASPKSKGLRATAAPGPSTENPLWEARLAHRPLGKGPAALGGGPALPQISRRGWAEESVAGVCWAQVFEGWEGFF